jgi:2,3-diaminopropionate biosynthesis protein SbnA
MIYNSILEVMHPHCFLRLNDLPFGAETIMKIEGYNPSSSIKIKPALHIIETLEKEGKIIPNKTKIIESSSGNFGIALSIVCRLKSYDFTCVVDPYTSLISLKYIQLYGGKLIYVKNTDINGGYLGSRIELIKQRILNEKDCFWVNQYANLENPNAHYLTTAQEIDKEMPELEYLFIGAGTTGTLRGCATYFKKKVKIIAVDAYGSVSFGQKAAQRKLPGIGTSRKPEIFCMDNIHDVVIVKEEETIKMAQKALERWGFLGGPSSASVLAAIQKYTPEFTQNPKIVAISPDLGDKYLDTLYNQEWINQNYS